MPKGLNILGMEWWNPCGMVLPGGKFDCRFGDSYQICIVCRGEVCVWEGSISSPHIFMQVQMDNSHFLVTHDFSFWISCSRFAPAHELSKKALNPLVRWSPLIPIDPGELATYAWLAVFLFKSQEFIWFSSRHGLLGAPIMQGIHSMEQRKKASTFKQWTNSPIIRSGDVTWSYFNDLMKILKFALNSSHLTHMEPPRSPGSTWALS